MAQWLAAMLFTSNNACVYVHSCCVCFTLSYPTLFLSCSSISRSLILTHLLLSTFFIFSFFASSLCPRCVFFVTVPFLLPVLHHLGPKFLAWLPRACGAGVYFNTLVPVNQQVCSFSYAYYEKELLIDIFCLDDKIRRG